MRGGAKSYHAKGVGEDKSKKGKRRWIPSRTGKGKGPTAGAKPPPGRGRGGALSPPRFFGRLFRVRRRGEEEGRANGAEREN